MPFVEDNSDFFQRQGGDSIYVDGLYVFANGARMERGGLRFEPPASPHELARVQQTYWRAKLDRAKEQFARHKQGLIDEARAAERNGFPPPDPGGVRELQRLQKAVQDVQKKVTAAEAEVERFEGRTIEAARLAEAKQRADEFVQQVFDIKV